MPEEVETVTEAARNWWLMSQGTLSFSLDITPLNVLIIYWILSLMLGTWALARMYANSRPEEWGGGNSTPPFEMVVALMVIFAPIMMPFALAHVFAKVYKPRPLP